MKRRFLLLALLFLLPLSGCRKAPAPVPAPDPAPAPTPQPDPAWHFALSSEVFTADAGIDGGVLLASVRYEIPQLRIEDADGSPFEGDAPARGVDAAMLAVRDSFNRAFDDYRDAQRACGELADLAQESYDELNEEYRPNFLTYRGAFEPIGQFERGDLISLRSLSTVYLGGAHSVEGVVVHNFDLADGEFFTLADLSDTPETFRAALIDLLLAQIEQEDLARWYFDSYEARIRAKESFNAAFGADGVTVYFSEYELAPYASGIPEVTIPYAELAPYCNARGQRLLPAA